MSGSSRRQPPPSPQALSGLAARLTDGHDSVPADRDVGARWERLRDAMENAGARRPRRRVGWLVGAGTAALAAAAILLWLGWWQGSPVTYALVGASLDGDGYISGVATTPAALTFSEGTKVELTPGSRAVVLSTDRRGARVRLEDGRAHFAVVHRPRARWAVDAGPFTVQVTGTSFDVHWSGGDELFEVRLLVGSINVRGPLTGGGVTLQAGETLEARLNQGVVRVERVAPSASPASAVLLQSPAPVAVAVPFSTAPAPSSPLLAAAPAAAPGPAASARRSSDAPTPAPSRAAHRRLLAKAAPPSAINVGLSWRQRVASGDFRSVLDEAEEQGLPSCLRALPEDRLAALADAARYIGRADVAADALLAQRQRFAGSPAARRAAFLLGRLAEESGDASSVALRWYETYLGEAPSGSYASEALGRKMLVLVHDADVTAASQAAREYLRRFPGGAYAAQAQAIAAGVR